MGISYNTDHSLKSLNEGGQAGALRDQKKIQELTKRYDLKNPEVAFEVYEQMVADPYYFETETGKRFQREVLRRAIRSEQYLSNETALFGRESVKESKPQKGKKEKTKRKLVLIVVALILGTILAVNLYEVIEYQVLSYQSAKKIEQLISCILTPVEGSVSEENRLDDMIASGLAPTRIPQIAIEETVDTTKTKEPEVLYKYSTLYKRNSDMAGWIRIDDTIINYPIMQTKEEEEFYLLRDFDKNDDINGLPFLDARCDINNRSNNLIIYGHNMKNGSMFSKLLNYEKESFYKEHKTIVFDTIYEEGIYDIIAVFQTRVAYQDEDTFRYYNYVNLDSEEEYTFYVDQVRKMSYYETDVQTSYGDELLTLSTCDRRINHGRFVVVARKRK